MRKPFTKLFMVMYSPDRIPDDSALVIYKLTIEKGEGKMSLTLIHHFHNVIQRPMDIFSPTDGQKVVFYFKHKDRLQIFETSSRSRKKPRVYHRAGGLPHLVAGYFYDESSAMTYAKSILKKIFDDKLKTKPLRELNRASILRRLFVDKNPSIVLNSQDLKKITGLEK